MCSLKPRSETPDRMMISQGPGLPIRLRDRVIPDPSTATNGVYPKPCRVDTLRIDLNVDPSTDDGARQQYVDAARYRQDLVFGTREHTNTYNALRQAQEGLHGFVKDDAKEALAAPGKRRIRGLAAQSLFAAVLLAAAAVRKVRVFLRNALTDPDTGDRYVLRRTRKGEHATTHLPPGTKGTRGSPDDESDTDDADDTAGAA
jgi:hypothetical protein